MMKEITYKHLCLFVVSPLLWTSCSTEDKPSLESDVPMNFTCATVPQTRATTYGEFTGENFGVVGTKYEGDYKTTDGTVLMNNVQVTYSGGKCSTDNVYFWPKEENMHFAACAPFFTNPASANGMKITLPQKPYQGYSFSGKVDGETNLMFANEQYGTLDDFTNGSVPIQFNHALTQVKFQAGLATGSDEKYRLNIKSLNLRNIRHTGSVVFTHNGKSDYKNVEPAVDANLWNTENMLWTVDKNFPVDSDFDANYLGDYTVSADNMSGIATTLKDFDDCLYLMPQSLYSDGESEFLQQIEVTYTISTNGVEGGEVTSAVPLKLDDITQWTVNKSVLYSLVMSPERGVTLTVEVQPWVLEQFENEFSDIVTVNAEGRIQWTHDYYTPDGNKVVLHDDITKPARFTFTIAGPLGGTWRAFFITKEGDSNAFSLSQIEGSVGTPCEVSVSANYVNTSNVANQAELRFVVIKSGLILPVDNLTADGENFIIVHNINK